MKKSVARLARQSPAMVVAMIALFVALSGTAVATTSALITGAQIKNNSISGVDVKNKSLTQQDFKGSVRGADGATGPQGVPGPKGDKGDKGDTGPPGEPNPNAVNALNADKLDDIDSTGFLAAGGKAVDAEKLDGVDSTGFLSSSAGAVTTANIDDGAVTRAKMAPDALTALAFGSVTSAGNCVSQSANVGACARTAGQPTGDYTITITGGIPGNAIPIATAVDAVVLQTAVVASQSSGSFRVRTFSSSGALVNTQFNFVVFKP